MEQTDQGLQTGPAEDTAPAPSTAQQPMDQGAGQQAADQEATPPADMEFIQVQEEEQFLADDEVIGARVVNQGGEEIGQIADLVMDQDQKLVGVVLSVGGFLGLGSKWVAVPVEQISFPTGDEPAQLLASVTEEQLTNAPDFITRKAIEQQEAAQSQQQAPAPSPAAPTQ